METKKARQEWIDRYIWVKWMERYPEDRTSDDHVTAFAMELAGDVRLHIPEEDRYRYIKDLVLRGILEKPPKWEA